MNLGENRISFQKRRWAMVEIEFYNDKTKTSQVGATLKAQKAQSFQTIFMTFSMENSQKVSKHPKDELGARKTLQRFGYSVLGHMGVLFLNVVLFPNWNANLHRIQIYNANLHCHNSDIQQYFRTSTTSLVERNLRRIKRQKLG